MAAIVLTDLLSRVVTATSGAGRSFHVSGHPSCGFDCRSCWGWSQVDWMMSLRNCSPSRLCSSLCRSCSTCRSGRERLNSFLPPFHRHCCPLRHRRLHPRRLRPLHRRHHLPAPARRWRETWRKSAQAGRFCSSTLPHSFCFEPSSCENHRRTRWFLRGRLDRLPDDAIGESKGGGDLAQA